MTTDADPSGQTDDWSDGATGDFAVESVPPEGAQKPDGPPDEYRVGSWYDRSRVDWWWDGKPDPCPVRPVGQAPGGNYFFVTPVGELRSFTATSLSRGGGLADLFASRVWWLIKHFPAKDRRTGEPTKRPNTVIAAEAMMRACVDAGYISGKIEHRLTGTWRGPDGLPIVHVGDAIIRNGELLRPGTRIGGPLYVIASKVERPLMEKLPGGVMRYADVPPTVGHNLVGALLNWNAPRDGSVELIAGFIAAGSLGDATDWRSHFFLRARPGAGKSTLLNLMRAALGGAGHEVANNYSAAFVEGEYAGQACVILLDEQESGTDLNRMKRLTELIRLLSDHGGVKGGRGRADGTTRKLDVHGAVCAAATIRGQWKQQDKERITVVELERFESQGLGVLSHGEIEALIKRVADMSPALRARMLGKFDLFTENLKRARAAIVRLGGTARDGNQLGHLLAGWWTLTCDHPADEDMLADVGARFLSWIVSIADAEEGTDPASRCWNRLLGADARVWRGGETLTVGQVIARAREPTDGGAHRRALLGMGLRLLAANVHDRNPNWLETDLAIANVHPGLDEIFAGSDWSNGGWADVLPDLEFHTPEGSRVGVQRHGPVQFGGPKSRGVLVPASCLPSMKDEEP
jgi:hypothetical protein